MEELVERPSWKKAELRAEAVREVNKLLDVYKMEYYYNIYLDTMVNFHYKEIVIVRINYSR